MLVLSFKESQHFDDRQNKRLQELFFYDKRNYKSKSTKTKTIKNLTVYFLYEFTIASCCTCNDYHCLHLL